MKGGMMRRKDIKLLFTVAFIGLAVLAGCARQHPVAASTCPAIGAIQQQKQQQGYLYFSVAPGAGWNGENPYAQESYLAGLKFISAAIRTGQNGPFVACDYEGPEQFAFLRMSRRFMTLPQSVQPNWDDNAFCKPGSGNVADCLFLGY